MPVDFVLIFLFPLDQVTSPSFLPSLFPSLPLSLLSCLFPSLSSSLPPSLPPILPPSHPPVAAREGTQREEKAKGKGTKGEEETGGKTYDQGREGETCQSTGSASCSGSTRYDPTSKQISKSNYIATNLIT